MRRAQRYGMRRFGRRCAYTPTTATKSVPPAKQDGWMNAGRTRQRKRLKILESEAKEASEASAHLFDLVVECEELTLGPPECLAEAKRVDIDASDVFQAWARMGVCPRR